MPGPFIYGYLRGFDHNKKNKMTHTNNNQFKQLNTCSNMPGGLYTAVPFTNDALSICAYTGRLFTGIRVEQNIKRPDKVYLYTS